MTIRNNFSTFSDICRYKKKKKKKKKNENHVYCLGAGGGGVSSGNVPVVVDSNSLAAS